MALLLAGLSGCAQPAPKPPEAAPSPIAAAATQIVVSADPRASAAGLEMLHQGGTAIDAAIAVQAVLGLVEPQASGFLGGSVLLVWDPAHADITVYDGQPIAPADSTRAVALGRSGKLLDPREVAFSGRAVGVPGTLPALWAAHLAAGKLPWASLFAPAIALAEQGTAMSQPLHALVAEPDAKASLGDAAGLYFDPNGMPLLQGALYRNAAYAEVLKRVARLGPDGLYAEGGMAAILDSLHRGPHPSPITEADLRSYRPHIATALCTPWQGRRICTAPPPAMGGVVMLQILGMVGTGDPTDPAFVHRFLEASRLAEADRRRYLADPAFVPVPLEALLSPSYLASRAATIAPDIPRPAPGRPIRARRNRPPPPWPSWMPAAGLWP
jgi:gamma-glutamyltranspeptidase/glutathione hydrolase